MISAASLGDEASPGSPLQFDYRIDALVMKFLKLNLEKEEGCFI